MKIYILVSPVVLVGALTLAHSAHAKTIRSDGHPPGTVKKAYNGTFFPPNEQGVYGCINKDGSGIVCGGVGEFSKSCDTWPKGTANIATPARTTLPSREEIRDQVDNPKP